MNFTKILTTGAVALALPLAGPVASSAAKTSSRRTMVVLHWGGFTGGTPALVAPAASYFRAHGWSVINVDYPLGDPAVAARYVHRVIVREHATAAYGVSAGGSLAALAAARGWVQRAVAVSPVTDVVRWGRLALPDMPVADTREASPMTYANRHSNPAWIITGTADTIVAPADAIRLHKRWASSKLTIRQGMGHIIGCLDYRASSRYLKETT